MKWSSESWEAYGTRVKQWHDWFAWYPVRVGERRVWLETVSRREVVLHNYLRPFEWQYALRPAATNEGEGDE